MQWTMPHRVLQVVAVLIVATALGGFTLGVINGTQRGRLPGERTAHSNASIVPAVQAVEAAPLSQERIEGPPPPTPLTPEEKAQADADKAAKTQADAAKLAANGTAAPATKAPAAPPTALAAPAEKPVVEKPAEPATSEEPPH
jgi:hypothetical protein